MKNNQRKKDKDLAHGNLSGEDYLQMRIEQENKWIYEHLQCPKAIFLGIITGGFYYLAQNMNYLKRIGLI